MKNLLKALVGAAAVCVTVSSFAFLFPKSSGIYVEGNVGLGAEHNNMRLHWKNFESWFGASVNLGYKINMFSTIEVGAARFPKQNASNAPQSNDNYFGDIAGTLIMPFDNGVNLFAKGGYGRMYQNKHGENVWVVGAGMALYVDHHNGFVLQGFYTPKKGPIPSRYMATIGLRHIF